MRQTANLKCLTLPAEGEAYLAARLAAVLNDQLSVITTTEEWIPEPPLGGDRQVRLMDDLRYGSDEYTMWPQPWHPDLPHLPCIRAVRKGHVEDILFGDVADTSFVPIRTQGFTGLGFIEESLFHAFYAFVADCNAREVALHRDDKVVFQSRSQSEVYYSGTVDIQSFLCRLRALPSTWLTTRRTLRHLQRALLEWDAWLRYWEVFVPRMRQIHRSDSTADETKPIALGCFVYRTEDAETMHRAGLPFWLIRPYEYVLALDVQEVGYIVKATDMDLSAVPQPRDSRPIFTGAATDIRRYESIRGAGRALLSFTDPFSAVAAPTLRIPNLKGSVSQSPGEIRALNKAEQRRKTGSPCK